MNNPFKPRQVLRYLGAKEGNKAAYVINASKDLNDIDFNILPPLSILLVLTTEVCKCKSIDYIALECVTPFGNKFILVSEEYIKLFVLLYEPLE